MSAASGDDRPPSDRSRGRGGHRGAPRHRGNGDHRSWTTQGELPRWIVDSLTRVTPQDRVAEAVSRLEQAARAFAEGRHREALREAERTKELAPREATVRELIGLAAYRLQRWDQALRELRAFRRLTGEAAHLPVEMDVLRALGRPSEVEELWRLMSTLDADRATTDEAKVVYGSFLLDRGDDRRAWEVTGPKRIGDDPEESELRVWYVAARAAHRLGDDVTAARLRRAIEEADPAFPGLDELDDLLGGPSISGRG
jgi:tetratricopeptide (TPR) repeat protein